MLLFAASLLAGISAQDSVSARPRPIHQFAHRTWAAQDGAPTEIRMLAQTADGYLWLGTVSGLVRFDGVRFVPFRPRGTDTIPTAGVRALEEGRDGTLWVVWETGAVSHLVNGRLTTYGVKDGLSPAFQLAESSRGEVVAGTNRGLARLTNGRWKDSGSEWGFTGTEARALWFDRSDALWVETTDRMVYHPVGAPGFLDPGWRLRRVAYQGKFAQAADGTIWFPEADRSVHTLRTLGDTTPVTEVQVGSTSVLLDRKGSLWIATHGDGLRRVSDPSRIRGRVVAQFGPEAEQFTEEMAYCRMSSGTSWKTKRGISGSRPTEGWNDFARGVSCPTRPAEEIVLGQFLPLATPPCGSRHSPPRRSLASVRAAGTMSTSRRAGATAWPRTR